MVIDNDFLKIEETYPDFELTSNIKVYSRISPENKALIVRTLKRTILKAREELPKWKQLMEVEMDKVGMVGDGANDLLAIK